jgi:TetR/AcrR family transcriptional regulator, cholesterol catabolism regulator
VAQRKPTSRAGVSAEEAALELAHRRPDLGQFRAASELCRQGIAISPSGVRAIWKRHGLATALQRLSVHSKASADTELTDTQRARLRRARLSHRLLARDGAADGDGAGRRAQVLAAAAREFSAKGYEASSLRNIAAAAGVLAGSLYHHFRSKDDLFATVHAEGIRQLHEALDRSLAGLSDPWHRLEAACATHLDQLVNGNDIAVVTATSLFRTMRPSLQRRLNRQRDDYERRFRDLTAALPVRRGIDRSLLRLLVLGALNWTRVWYRPGKLQPAEIARQWIRQLLQDCAAPGKEIRPGR